MIRQESIFQKQAQQQTGLNYQNKKLLHMIELQILDIENTLHYIQKKHTMHQLKQALSQIYNIFNETEPLFVKIKGLFLHQQMKKIMNCFGIIYVILMEHVQKDKHHVGLQKDEKKGQKNHQEIFKAVDVNISSIGKCEDKVNFNKLGGVHLYNQHHIRHLENQSRNTKPKGTKKVIFSAQTPKYELNKLINDQINDTSYIDSHPDQILDIFSFKFKYGRQNQIVTFHDELLSIANFFKQSQNQAFQFLNKTKQQTSLITYNDSFRDIMSQIKKEKQDKLHVFNEKIKIAFQSIKAKTQQKLSQIQTQLHYIELAKKEVSLNRLQVATNTIFDIDEEIKELNKKLADSQQKYKLMINFKKKEIQQNAMISLQLQNEIGLKNREIVYLKLNIQENTMVISSLSKKIKFLNDANKKIKDIVKNTHQPTKIQQILQHKQEQQFLKEEKANQMELQSVKKQRKMAKKILLNQRRKSFVGQKSLFLKRFTQQLDSSTPKNLLSRKLSEIAQSESSQINNKSDSQSLISNKNRSFDQNTFNRPIKKISIINNAQITQSSPSIKSSQQFSKSKKILKQKHSSQLQKYSRTSLLNKLNISSMINEDSILDECSSSQLDCFEGEEIEGRGLYGYQFNKVEELFKKQMKRSKNIMNHKQKVKKSSFFNNNKIIISQKNNHQSHQNTFLKRSSKSIRASLESIRQNQNKNIDQVSQSMQKQSRRQLNDDDDEVYVNDQIHSFPQQIKKQLSFCAKEYNLKIQIPQPTILQIATQTQQTKYAQSNFQKTQEQTFTNIPTFSINNSFNNLQFLHSKEKKLSNNQHQIGEIVTRSATQSKIIKTKHMKTLYTLTNKQNQKYAFPATKNTEKSVDQIFNNRSYEEAEERKKQIEKPNVPKKQTFYEQTQKSLQQRQLRNLATKSKTLQQFKIRVTQMHKQKCGSNCKHLQKFVQNYLKYKQQQKQKIKMPIKNMCDNIAYTSAQSQQKNHFPIVQKKKY